ncbi:Fibroblast growth factor receptor 2 [Amphibalanus amphitrite]|uniref:Fibroblast growth factor receptor 2 n=1 Tax=Amphibalanus amphitrite TaxID=1232801 RepID=A0A6A4WZV4_AMPAM|nr:Fibroblast growth factor receptor 2 [Amphibalanus amphitrite]
MTLTCPRSTASTWTATSAAGRRRRRSVNGTGEETKPYFANKDELRRMQAVPLGDPVTICCHIKGSPAPEIQWLYNGRPLSESSHTVSHVEVGRYSLFVPSMRQYDNGNYTCVGRNLLGEVSHMTYLEANGEWMRHICVVPCPSVSLPAACRGCLLCCAVLCCLPCVPPAVLCADGEAAVGRHRRRFQTRPFWSCQCIEEGYPLNVTAFIGENATFDCLGSWDWEMDLFWVFSENNTVHVRDLADMDRLNRQAINEKQTLTDPPVSTAPPQPHPIITRAPRNVTLVTGEQANFVCEVTAGMHSQLDWYWSATAAPGAHVTKLQDGGRFDISTKQRLVIHNVTLNDTGFYTCIAYNTLAKAHARAYLTVLEPSHIDQTLRHSFPDQTLRHSFPDQTLRHSFPDQTLRYSFPASPVSLGLRHCAVIQTMFSRPGPLEEIPVPLAHSRITVILSVVFGVLVLAGIILVARFYGRMRLERRERERAVEKANAFHAMTKKVIIDHQNMLANGTIVAPTIRIERCKVRLRNQFCNLRSYLRERRHTTGYERAFDHETPTVRELTSFAYQVARGMEYLAAKKVRMVVSDDIMRQCWEYYPNLRPTFTELVEKLGTLLTSLAPQEYLDLGQPSPPDSGDSSHDVSVDSQFELFKSTGHVGGATSAPPGGGPSQRRRRLAGRGEAARTGGPARPASTCK